MTTDLHETSTAEAARGSHSRTWRYSETWVAALPPVLFGLSLSAPYLSDIVTGRLIIGGATPIPPLPQAGAMWAIGVGVALLTVGALVAVGLALTRRQPLPSWGHTWTASATTAILAALMIAGDDVPYLISPLADTLLGSALLLMLGLAIIAAGRSSPFLGGMAGLSAAIPMTLLLVFAASAFPFRRLDISLLASMLGLGFGIVIARAFSARSGGKWSWTLIGALLCLGTMAALEYAVFGQWHVSHGQTGTAWLLPAVIVALLGSGPAVGLILRRLKRSPA